MSGITWWLVYIACSLTPFVCLFHARLNTKIWILDKRRWTDMSYGDIVKDAIVTTGLAFTPWLNIVAQCFVAAYIVDRVLNAIDSSKHHNRFTAWLEVKPWQKLQK